ncbi:MAG TPA: hypothetical protein VNH18_23180 [Bryobacteraceae bacterium]|nr:hypothetical protein [Bryobacteraceae bacterium]
MRKTQPLVVREYDGFNRNAHDAMEPIDHCGHCTLTPWARAEMFVEMCNYQEGFDSEQLGLMRRYNQRLFRIARAFLRDAGVAEDVIRTGSGPEDRPE